MSFDGTFHRPLGRRFVRSVEDFRDFRSGGFGIVNRLVRSVFDFFFQALTERINPCMKCRHALTDILAPSFEPFGDSVFEPFEGRQDAVFGRCFEGPGGRDVSGNRSGIRDFGGGVGHLSGGGFNRRGCRFGCSSNNFIHD
jgi:hypothetical protein